MKYVFFKKLGDNKNVTLFFSNFIQHLHFKNSLTPSSRLGLTPYAGFAVPNDHSMTVFGKSISIGVDGESEEVQSILNEEPNLYYLKFDTDYFSVPEHVLFPANLDFDSISDLLSSKFGKIIDSGLLKPCIINEQNNFCDENKPGFFFNIVYREKEGFKPI